MDWPSTGTLIGLIIAFCYLLDWLVSKEKQDRQKTTIIGWWSRLDDFNYREAVRNSNIFCNGMLDTIYGKGHLTSRCYGISCIISTILVFILTIGWLAIGSIPARNDGTLSWGASIIMAMMMNLQVDYISLMETRLILRVASRVKPLMLPVLLLADLLLSAMICLLAALVFFCLIRVLDPSELPPRGPYKFLLDAITWNNEASILFYSTFSANLIFYLYFLSTLFFKFMGLSKTRIMVVLERLEDSDHLFKALGGLLALLASFVMIVVELWQILMQA